MNFSKYFSFIKVTKLSTKFKDELHKPGLFKDIREQTVLYVAVIAYYWNILLTCL